MAYQLIVVLDDGVTVAGATRTADEIRADYEGDVVSVTVHEVEPERPSDD